MHRRDLHTAQIASAPRTRRLVVGLVVAASLFFGFGSSPAEAGPPPELGCTTDLTEAQCAAYLDCVAASGVEQCGACLEMMMMDSDALCGIEFDEPIIILHLPVHKADPGAQSVG